LLLCLMTNAFPFRIADAVFKKALYGVVHS
jgi:hypothetical protein